MSKSIQTGQSPYQNRPSTLVPASKIHSYGRFDDCLKLRRRVDEKPYLLPDPPLFNALPELNNGINLTEPIPSDHLAYTHFGSIQSQSSPPASTTTIFKGNRKKIFLGKISESVRGFEKRWKQSSNKREGNLWTKCATRKCTLALGEKRKTISWYPLSRND